MDFLAVGADEGGAAFDLEDALPSTMTRKKALELKAGLVNGKGGEVNSEATFVAASYYPGTSFA